MRRVWNVEEGLGGEGDPEGGEGGEGDKEGGGEGDENVLEEEVIPGGCCRPPSVQTASSLH